MCHRLKSVMEFCFPEELERRKQELDLEAAGVVHLGLLQGLTISCEIWCLPDTFYCHPLHAAEAKASGRLSRQLGLVRAPNPVTFEAEVQEQHQQRRRRQQQHLELQQLTAELNNVLSPDMSALSLWPPDPDQHRQGAGLSIGQQAASTPVLESSFADIQRSLPPRPNSSGPSEGRNTAFWLGIGQGRVSARSGDGSPTRGSAAAGEYSIRSTGHMRTHSAEMTHSRPWSSSGVKVSGPGDSLVSEPQGLTTHLLSPSPVAGSSVLSQEDATAGSSSSRGGGSASVALPMIRHRSCEPGDFQTQCGAGEGGGDGIASQLPHALSGLQPPHRLSSSAFSPRTSHRGSDCSGSQLGLPGAMVS